MGVGAGVVALSIREFFSRSGVSRFGSEMMSVYLVHYLLVESMEYVDARIDSFTWQIAYPVLVLVISVSVVRCMASVRLFRWVLGQSRCWRRRTPTCREPDDRFTLASPAR